MNKLSLRPNFEVCLKETITFSNGELVLNEEARITPIVLEVGMTQEEVDKCRVKQVLVNKGATKNILYFKYFKEIEMNDNHLKPSNMVLKGFTAHKISVKGTVRVHVTIDTDNCTQEEELKFYVVDIDSPYNAILGTPTNAAFELVISMSHQQVRFSTKNGVGCVKSNSRSLLEYMMKSKQHLDERHNTNEVGSIQATKEGQVPKQKDFDKVVIHPDYPDQRVQIRREMSPGLKKR